MADKKAQDKIDWEETENTPEEQQSENEKKEKKSEIKKLKGELEETKKKLEEALKNASEANDKYLRTAAEYENYRKRTQSERLSLYGDAVADTLGGLLLIIDNQFIILDRFT